jgi:hypothetical protein
MEKKGSRKRGLRWFFGGFVLLAVLATGYANYTYEEVLVSARQDAVKVTNELEKKVKNHFSYIDEVLNAAAFNVLYSDDADKKVLEYLHNLKQSYFGINALEYIDEEGIVRYSTDTLVGKISLADRPYFQKLKNPKIQKTFSNVISVGDLNERYITRLIGLYDTTGKFIGAVSAHIGLNEVDGIVSSVYANNDIQTYVRNIYTFDYISKNSKDDQNDFYRPLIDNDNMIAKQIALGMREAGFWYDSNIDDEKKFASFKVMRQYPFYVEVTLSADKYLAPWKRDVVTNFTIILLLALYSSFVLYKVKHHRLDSDKNRLILNPI